MNNNDKYKLYTITIIIDLILIYSLLKINIESFDFIFIFISLNLHILFYYSIYFYDKEIMDFLHYCVFLFPFLAIFTNSVYIKFVCLFLLFVIQILWIFEKRCIMNEIEDEFGYGDSVTVYTLTLTVILSFLIGKNF